jgi:hypothetical protein
VGTGVVVLLEESGGGGVGGAMMADATAKSSSARPFYSEQPSFPSYITSEMRPSRIGEYTDLFSKDVAVGGDRIRVETFISVTCLRQKSLIRTQTNNAYLGIELSQVVLGLDLVERTRRDRAANSSEAATNVAISVPLRASPRPARKSNT